MTSIDAATGIQHIDRGYAAVIDDQQVGYYTGRGCQRRAIAAAGSGRLLTLRDWSPPTVVRRDNSGAWGVIVAGRVSATYTGPGAKRRAIAHAGPHADVERPQPRRAVPSAPRAAKAVGEREQLERAVGASRQDGQGELLQAARDLGIDLSGVRAAA